METTEAIFEDISVRILEEISSAQKCIYVAVAWFTNQALFNELVKKAVEGCQVYLIISNDEINNSSSIQFDRLNTGKSSVYKIGDTLSELMHNKFCIIDHSTVITGSYNWSYKAERNYENIVISKNATSLAAQFISEFNKIRKKYYPHDNKLELDFPIQQIIRRLEILKNYILLEDINEIEKEAHKLKDFDYNSDIFDVLEYLAQKDYSSVIRRIQIFISNNQQLSTWTDPEVSALKLQIKNLENKLNAFDNEKTELEKILSEFLYRQTIELGKIILEILRLRKIKYKHDEAKYKEAQQDEKQYQEQISYEKDKNIQELSDEERKELKKKYRRATVMCHPDKVSDEFKDAAHEIFINLKNAYDTNDLKKVDEILDRLEKGNIFTAKSDTIVDKELLKETISRLQIQIELLQNDIVEIKNNVNYKLIISITNWDDYFKLTKEKLLKELELLRSQSENFYFI